MKKYLWLLCCICSFNIIGQEKEWPEYLYKVEIKDSTYLTSKNTFNLPIHIAIFKKKKQKDLIVLFPNDSLIVQRYLSRKFDEKKVLKKFRFQRRYGNPLLQKYDTFYPYQPPFMPGHNYKVLQGYHGKFSHQSSESRYAIDFQIPVGDTICAARKGVVVNAVRKYDQGGRSKKFKPYANYILLYHEDGTWTQYVHLKHQGVFVEIGDIVEEGQPIGLSGNTGMSTEPHLHFSVYISKGEDLISIPAMFNKVPGKKFTKGTRIKY